MANDGFMSVFISALIFLRFSLLFYLKRSKLKNFLYTSQSFFSFQKMFTLSHVKTMILSKQEGKTLHTSFISKLLVTLNVHTPNILSCYKSSSQVCRDKGMYLEYAVLICDHAYRGFALAGGHIQENILLFYDSKYYIL